MGSALGVRKGAANKAGVTLEEYDQRVASGEKWCTGCRDWHPREAFKIDVSRYDGLTSSCSSARSIASRARYQPRPRPLPGRRYAVARDGDFKQARGRVNHLVNVGLLPDPNDVPCADCGHSYGPGERRHEYDHHHGYGADHHECVEAVCTACHHAREDLRRAA